jgi:hypothetical protein
MTKHAAGQSTASLTVAGALKLAVPVGVSVQHLDGLMLAAGATAATPRQQEERPRSDIGQRCGKAQPAGSPNNLYLQIAHAQAPHVGEQQWSGPRDRRSWHRRRRRRARRCTTGRRASHGRARTPTVIDHKHNSHHSDNQRCGGRSRCYRHSGCATHLCHGTDATQANSSVRRLQLDHVACSDRH